MRWGSRTRASHVWLDIDGIRARSRREVLVDVAFDDRRVWSFWLHRDGVPEGLHQFVPWPPPLQKYLDGVARLTLVDSVTRDVLHDETVRFGNGDARISVTAPSGEPLSIDKSLKLVRTFETRTNEQIEPLITAIETVLGALKAAGVDAFLAYGTALGAVREGRVLGHDSDADLGYVSRYDHPVDVIRESFRLQRKLTALGSPVTRYSAAAFKVHVREADGHDRGLDVFGGFFRNDNLYLMGEIALPFRREWIYPTTTAYLSGRPFPVPAEPDRFLSATYGAGWRQPDPAFKFATPASTSRRFDGWFRGMRIGRPHWDRFYSRASRQDPKAPSSLVQWAADRDGLPASFVDIGCGRGEDVRYLAERGVHAVGLDAVPKSYAGVARELEGTSTAHFQQLNVLEMRPLLAVAAWAARLPARRTVQVRHVVESLPRAGRNNVWRAARMILAGTDGRVYAEVLVRRGKDGYAREAGLRKRLSRRVVLAELEAAGATVLQHETVDVTDHPRSARVCRVVAQFGDPQHRHAGQESAR